MAFLGTAGYYRKFVPNYSSVAKPLTDLTRKNQPRQVTWTPECEEAFCQLKDALTNTPVLAAPDPTKRFLVHTDASMFGLGAVLSQVGPDGKEHPVAYLSRKLLPREVSYAAIEKECLAIWGKLHTDLFVKGTDRNNILHFSSEHPRRMVESPTMESAIKSEKNCLVGYPKVELDKFRERALSRSWDELLVPKMAVQSQKRIPFVTTYNGMSKQVSNIIRRHWPLLGRGHTDIVEFQQPPLFSYRRNRNLKDQLVVSDIGSTKKDLHSTFSRPRLGNSPCLGCACCNNMIKGSSFCHPHTGKNYEIRRRYQSEN
ncbi:unnamed protein product [Ranitomeya imitator]|uniref:Reverse transcriptase/retrotransposon-derived protein RNase H-like domain-containing protein n=1 Tax=Ranitomeya imitator TaxID=111125 RepID=A0ABN9M781_9NEOB|nr:unnamed protein product [Ranitomeya imitator]